MANIPRIKINPKHILRFVQITEINHSLIFKFIHKNGKTYPPKGYYNINQLKEEQQEILKLNFKGVLCLYNKEEIE